MSQSLSESTSQLPVLSSNNSQVLTAQRTNIELQQVQIQQILSAQSSRSQSPVSLLSNSSSDLIEQERTPSPRVSYSRLNRREFNRFRVSNRVGRRFNSRMSRFNNMGQKYSTSRDHQKTIPREFAKLFTCPERLDALLDMPKSSVEIQEKYSWNEDDRSLNVYVKEDDKLTFHRHPVAQSTDCIRGKVGFSKGLHLWEINWPTRLRGTHAVVGVATIDAPLHSVGYRNLVGFTDQSWGWDLVRSKLYHDSKNGEGNVYPEILKPDENFPVPETFMIALDMDVGTLSFIVNGQYLGVAFRGLRGKHLYPIVSTVWGHCEVSMRYFGGLDRE
jgi:SPRY domain-containing SOCS box protein 1/4